jgi:hypothetical protein
MIKVLDPELLVKDIVSCSLHYARRDTGRHKFYVGRFGSIIHLRLTAQIFRIYRDVRFSKDPTPYKASLPVP